MRPAVPLYWRATPPPFVPFFAPPADFVPFFRTPVSSTISTASRSANGSTTYARHRSRAAASSHCTCESSRCVRHGRAAEMLGQLPAFLAFHRTQQALKIKPHLPTRLGASEQLAQPSVQLTQLRPPLKNTRYTHAPSRCNPPWIPAI